MDLENYSEYLHKKLSAQFAIAYCEVMNESHKHHVPRGSASHFKIIIVTEDFVGKKRLERHQAVYACLAEELKTQIHALSLHCYTPEEWQTHPTKQASPPCRDGFGK